MALPQAAQAGTTVSLFNSFAGNINFVSTGGTFRNADNNTNACTVNTSSSATVSGIPAGSTIVAVYMYYAGSNNTADTTVTLNGTNVTADRTFTDGSVENFYGGFKDLTSSGIVTGNGTYTLTNMTISTGAPWCTDQTVLGGWSLVVIYSNATTETNRVINVYDGFQVFQNNSITLTPANFQVPNTSINGKFAVITWEGDPTLSGGETLSFNGTVLTDNCNGTNNQYNSTINTLTCTGTAATDDVYYGVDIDTFNVTSYLTAGDTSATTFYQSGQDAVVLAAQIISISNVPVSDLSITKTDGSASASAGSNTSYTLTVHNSGPAATTGTATVTDTLPSGESFVSATGTGWTCGNVSGTVTCTSTSAIANGSNYPTITLVASVATTASGTLANTASVALSGQNFDNVSGNNSATDSDTVAYPSDDLTISKTAVGTFTAGAPVSYTVTVTNNGPIAIPTGTTTTVTDTLPATLTFISGTGTGWSCNAVGQVVTCTSTSSTASGGTLPSITLTAQLSASVNANVVNTATVSNAFIADGTAGNNSSTSTVTNASINKPNYSTSTKTWVDLNGGDVAPGDTLEYTITVKDSAAKAGTNIEVTDDMPPEAASYSIISIPAGSTNASTGTGTGANGTGYLDITGISIPASGTVTIVVDVVLSGSLVTGTTVDNTASVVGGTAAANPAATTATVNQSQIAATGNKVLYLTTGSGLTRTPQATSATSFNVNSSNTNPFPSVSFTLTPALAKNLVLSGGGTITFKMSVQRTGNNSNRTYSATLLDNGTTTICASGNSPNFNNGGAVVSVSVNCTLGASDVTVLSGHTLVAQIFNSTNANTRPFSLFPDSTTSGASTVTLPAKTVINVDSINVYSAAYSSSSTQTIWEPNAVIYIRAVVSDPFGCDDVFPTGGTAPKLTLKDPSSTVILNAVTMTEPAADLTACTGTPTSPTKTFEYYVSGTTGYTLLNTAVEGFWTPSVTATEGTEAAVTHTANGSFEVRRPSLLILKSVSVLSDTTGNAKPRAYSGSVTQYNIVVSNTGKGRANGVSVSDAIPTNTSFILGSTAFSDGSTSSGLSAPTFTPYIDVGCSTAATTGNDPLFSSPAGTADGNIKCVKASFNPAATTFMNGQTGASAPSFTLSFKTQVN